MVGVSVFGRNEYVEDRIGMLLIPDQERVLPHRHEFFELAYIRSGQIVHTMDGQRTVLKAGDYFIIDMDTWHEYNTDPGNRCELLNCLFTGDAIDAALVNCRSFDRLLSNYLIHSGQQPLRYRPTNQIFHDEDGAIADRLERMYHEFEQRQQGYLNMMRCLLIEVIISTIRKTTSGRSMSRPFDADISGLVIDHIQQHYADDITLAALAEQLHYSLPHLSQRIRQDTGMTFTEHLQQTRIQKSCQLLTSTDLKITEVAQQVGYSDVAFFQRLFRKWMQMSPRQYRQLATPHQLNV